MKILKNNFLFFLLSLMTLTTYAQKSTNLIYECFIGLGKNVNKDSIVNSSSANIEQDETKEALKLLIPSEFLAMKVYVTIDERRIKIVRKNNDKVANSMQSLSDSSVFTRGNWLVYENGKATPIKKWEGTLTVFNDTKMINGYTCKKSIWAFSDTKGRFEIWTTDALPSNFNPFPTSDLKLNGGVVEARQLDTNFSYKLKEVAKM